MWNLVLQQLFPARCLLCELELPAGATRDLCGYCAKTLPWNRNGCVQCALPLAGASPLPGVWQDRLCADCHRIRPAFRMALAPLRYESFAANWVRGLKDDLGFVEGRLLATLLADAALAAYRDPQFPGRTPDCIVPVPLTRYRLAARGHNQALTLALPVARRLGVPVYRRALRRIRAAPAQRGLGRLERRQNLDGVFACRDGIPALRGPQTADGDTGGPCIAVIDDVITTGATGNAIAQVLLAAGAAEVHLLAAARTPRGSDRAR